MEVPEKTYFETHAEEMLRNAGMNKAQFSERMGIARQNVADTLNLPLSMLIYGNQSIEEHTIDGFIDVDGKIFRVRSKKDLENILYAL